VPTLPISRGSLTLANFDRSLAGNAASIDLSKLRFIDAYGMVGLACSLLVALEAGDGPVVVPPDEMQVRKHLSLMGLRDLLVGAGIEPVLPAATAPERHDVVVPLAKVSGHLIAEQLSHLLWEQLRQHAEPQVLNAALEGLWELVANALEHSGAQAVVMGQVYKDGTAPDHDRRVQVVIGDIGKGIRRSFLESGRYQPADDAEAIDLALKYLVTSVDDPGRGQGIFSTVEQVLELHGKLVIRSGTSKVSVDDGGHKHRTVAFLPGTLVCMSLPL
jgi:hypothetical protein